MMRQRVLVFVRPIAVRVAGITLLAALIAVSGIADFGLVMAILAALVLLGVLLAAGGDADVGDHKWLAVSGAGAATDNLNASQQASTYHPGFILTWLLVGLLTGLIGAALAVL